MEFPLIEILKKAWRAGWKEVRVEGGYQEFGFGQAKLVMPLRYPRGNIKYNRHVDGGIWSLREIQFGSYCHIFMRFMEDKISESSVYFRFNHKKVQIFNHFD